MLPLQEWNRHKGAANMTKRKAQSSIDSHFQRSIKLKTGEIVDCKPSEPKEKSLLYLCEYPGCCKRFPNAGSLSTHSRFIHPNAQERKESLPSISKFAIKSASLLVCSTPTLLALSPHVISSVSNLIPVPFIRPKLAIASPIEPPIKVDG